MARKEEWKTKHDAFFKAAVPDIERCLAELRSKTPDPVVGTAPVPQQGAVGGAPAGGGGEGLL